MIHAYMVLNMLIRLYICIDALLYMDVSINLRTKRSLSGCSRKLGRFHGYFYMLCMYRYYICVNTFKRNIGNIKNKQDKNSYMLLSIYALYVVICTP